VTDPAAANPAVPATVIFDLGGVLIDWNPRHLFRRLIPDPDAMELFLAEACSPAWNHQQDAGRPWADAVESLVAERPEHEDLIRAYDRDWEETVGEAFEGTVAILAELREAGVPVYALSNWSSDKFRLTRPRFPFLEWFDGLVISGDEGVAKPDPAIFRLLLERYRVDPATVIYVDDLAVNIEAAESVGMAAILFTDSDALRETLAGLGLPIAKAAATGA
jgi:2-haloacid dehalogenase